MTVFILIATAMASGVHFDAHPRYEGALADSVLEAPAIFQGGEVFTAATCEWVMGLTRRDRQVEQVTRNVLNRFLAS